MGNLNRLARAVAGFFLPSHCLACARRPVDGFFQGGVCESCWEAVPMPVRPSCERCAEPLSTSDAAFCGRCLLDPPEFRMLRAAAPYRGVAREILLAFKFRGADYLAPHLARLLAARLAGQSDYDEITAVPATARQRLRRDHAADLLGAALARELALPFAPERLEKVRATMRQSDLPLGQRAENVRGAFRATRPAPERILLVDDVATSGSTARSCARALLRAGAETVDVWCFARAGREDDIFPTRPSSPEKDPREPQADDSSTLAPRIPTTADRNR